MKKSILIIAAIFTVSVAAAQTIGQQISKLALKQDSTISASQAGNIQFQVINNAQALTITSLTNALATKQKTIDSLKASQVVVTTPGSPSTTTDFTKLNAEEKKYDYVYIAAASTKATNGSITSFPELISGKYPMNYTGIANPTITGIPPTMFDDRTAEFLNRPNTPYETAYLPKISPPYTVLLIGRKAFGQTYEAMLQGGEHGNYLSFSTGVRIINPDPSYIVPNSVVSDDYRMTAWQIIVNTNNTADYYNEGVKIGSVTFKGNDINNVFKVKNGVNVFTNASDWHFAAYYIKAGVFSAGDYATNYKTIANKWGVGTYLNEIILSKISWTRHGDAGVANTSYTFGVEYKSIPVGVTPADLSKWKIEWYYQANNFATQVTFSNKPVITTADLPANYKALNIAIGLRLTPLDTNGHYGIKHNGKNGNYANTDNW